MKGLAFGLLGLVLTLPRAALMGVAFILVHVCAALEGAQEWVDARAGIPQPVIEPDDRARTMADILKDFTAQQRMGYEEHVGDNLDEIVDRHGTDWTYYDLKDWVLK